MQVSYIKKSENDQGEDRKLSIYIIHTISQNGFGYHHARWWHHCKLILLLLSTYWWTKNHFSFLSCLEKPSSTPRYKIRCPFYEILHHSRVQNFGLMIKDEAGQCIQFWRGSRFWIWWMNKTADFKSDFYGDH